MSLARSAVLPEVGWNALIAEWLAGLFIAPLSATAVTSYREGLGATFLDTLLDECGYAEGAHRMRSALVTGDSAAAVARKLAAAFGILFEGVGGQRTVSPYESAHVSGTGRLFQAPVSDMDLLLRQADMSIDDAVGEPSDHLSIELALLARLMRGGTSPSAQAALLDDHLLVWVPVFADRCRKADSTDFYAGAASLLTGFLLAQRAAFQGNKTISPVPAVPYTSYATTGVTPCRSE